VSPPGSTSARPRLRAGYALAALGYALGIWLVGLGPTGPLDGGYAVVWSLLHGALFVGLTGSALLSLSDGQWSRPVPARLYAGVGLAGGLLVLLGEGRWALAAPGPEAAAHVAGDLLGVVGVLVAHRLGQRRPSGRPAVEGRRRAAPADGGDLTPAGVQRAGRP
jgi:hypothetical protein